MPHYTKRRAALEYRLRNGGWVFRSGAEGEEGAYLATDDREEAINQLRVWNGWDRETAARVIDHPRFTKARAPILDWFLAVDMLNKSAKFHDTHDGKE